MSASDRCCCRRWRGWGSNWRCQPIGRRRDDRVRRASPREVDRVPVGTHLRDVQTTQFGFWRRAHPNYPVHDAEEDVAQAADVDKARDYADHLCSELAGIAEE